MHEVTDSYAHGTIKHTVTGKQAKRVYARRRNSSSSNRMSSFRSYLLKTAAISAASLSDKPYFSGWKPYVSLALLSVRYADRFLSVDASAFSFWRKQVHAI